jgi:dTDP-4-amino-4,6-dideoxygalactose transaminase
LDISLRALDLPDGAEVLLPSITFISCADRLLKNRLVPVFCDIDPVSLCIDPQSIEQHLTEKSKLILPVHLYGGLAKMRDIHEIAERHDLMVIEDAAHATGAKYHGRPVGSLAGTAMTCFSFEAKKIITCGDGGMVTLNDEELFNKLRRLRNQGISADTFARVKRRTYNWDYDVVGLGERAYMNDVAGAIGLAQLDRVPHIIRKRRQLAECYTRHLQAIDEIEVPIEVSDTDRAWWAYVVKVRPRLDRDALSRYLARKGIATSVHYKPLYHHPLLREYRRDLPVTERVWLRILTLPLFCAMTERDVLTIVKSIKKWLAQRHRRHASRSAPIQNPHQAGSVSSASRGMACGYAHARSL